jgi:hypothetical protein
MGCSILTMFVYNSQVLFLQMQKIFSRFLVVEISDHNLSFRLIMKLELDYFMSTVTCSLILSSTLFNFGEGGHILLYQV